MSTSLYWIPPPEVRKEHSIGYLKYIIGKYFDPDYNGGSINHTAGKDLIPFLKGVAAAADRNTSEDALNLIAAIEKYGEVEIYTY